MSILITPEWPYCAYPVIVEVYNFCYHNCLYCFTKHKETWHNKAIQRIKRGFNKESDILDISILKAILSGEKIIRKKDKELKSFIEQRYAIQIGAQTDPGGILESKYGQTFELLKLLKNEGRNYPVRISTKGIALKNQKYLNILEDYNQATILISLVTTDENILKRIEPNAPSAKERLLFAKAISKTDAKLGLRLRPIIPKITEKNLRDLLQKAKDSGCEWVTVEWLRVPRLLTKKTNQQYGKLSDAIGFDIIDFYKQNSDINENRNGYLRLLPKFTYELFEQISSLCKDYELELSSCNKDYRCYQTYSPNCCGVPISDKSWNRMQISYAVYLAKINGKVRIDDILNPSCPLFKITNKDNCSVDYPRKSYGDTLKEIWNSPEHRFYPAKFFPELLFNSMDSEGNHIFSYNYDYNNILRAI